MTTPSTARKAGPYSGTGAQTSFPFTFKVFAASDVKVVVADANGDETVLTLGAQYSVTLNSNQETSPGGAITYPISGSPLPVGGKLSIIGNLPYDQTLDLPSGGNFSPLALENQLDRATIQIQQLKEQVDRAAKVPVTYDAADLEEFTADIVRLADSADNIDTVAQNIPLINSVAGDLETVADNVADVTNFADVYYGPSATDPATRRDGSALQGGDLYFNTGAQRMRVYAGGMWTDGVVNTATTSVQRFSGDGSAVAFTLAADPVSENNTQVFIGGVYQQKDTYGVSGTTLTFNAAPPAGTNNIEVVSTGTVAGFGTLPASAVTFTQSGTGAVDRTASAKLRDTVNVLDFGAVVGTDSAAMFQLAVNSGASVVEYDGEFVLEETVFVPWKVSLVGKNARTSILKSKAGGAYTANAMVLMNTTDGVTWVQAYPNIGVGSLKNVTFDNDAANVAGLIGAICAGSYEVSDVRGHNMTRIVEVTADYADNVEIRRVISRNAGSGYQVKVNQLGDGLIIEGCHFPLRNDTTFPNGIELIGCTGGTVRETIGGNNRVFRCSNVAIERPHLEGSTLTIDSSSVTLRQMFATPNQQGQANVRLLSTDAGKYAVTIEGYENAVWDNRIPSPYTPWDIQTHSDYEITLRNCFKRAYRSGNISISEITGVLLQKSDGSEFTQFNKLSHYLSTGCRIQRFQNVLTTATIPCGTGAFFSLSNTITSANLEWAEASATYYYRMQYLYDDDHKIGVTDSDAERSFSLTSGGSGLQHALSFSSRNPNVICRLYRGTSTGSYSHYCDVPLISARLLFDDGVVVNGHPWKTRAAGPVDTPNTVAVQLELTPARTRIITTTVPAVGTYVVGDQCEYLTPAAGGNIGIVCTTAGTPGTWKTFGAISA